MWTVIVQVKVLRRKLDERDKLYDELLTEVKAMASRVDVKGLQGSSGVASETSRPTDSRTHEEKLLDLAKDIELLKWKLTEKDKDSDKAKAALAGRTSGLQKE